MKRRQPKNYQQIKALKFKKFRLPIGILDQLNEFSKGFALFMVNDEGFVETYSQIDNPVVMSALANKMLHTGNILTSMEGEATAHEMLGDSIPEMPEDI